MREPALRLEVQDVSREENGWRVRWRVTNTAGDPVRLLSVQAPHSRFQADPLDLNKVLVDTAVVEQVLRVDAAGGEDIENAFVIFLVGSDDEKWRLLFRVRVRLSPDGTPSPVVEATTSHRVGFSEA